MIVFIVFDDEATSEDHGTAKANAFVRGKPLWIIIWSAVQQEGRYSMYLLFIKQ